MPSIALNVFNSSAPADQLLVRLLEISASPSLRYAEDVRDWMVTLEDASSATFIATGFDAESAGSDDSPSDERSISLPDIEGLLWRRLRANIGGTPLQIVLREYLSTDTSAPVTLAVLEVSRVSRSADGSSLDLTASNVDLGNRDAGMAAFTFANSPGLRGLAR